MKALSRSSAALGAGQGRAGAKAVARERGSAGLVLRYWLLASALQLVSASELSVMICLARVRTSSTLDGPFYAPTTEHNAFRQIYERQLVAPVQFPGLGGREGEAASASRAVAGQWTAEREREREREGARRRGFRIRQRKS